MFQCHYGALVRGRYRIRKFYMMLVFLYNFILFVIIILQVIDRAFSLGCRFIDTALAYKNHTMIAGVLKELLPKHKLRREDIFIVSLSFFLFYENFFRHQKSRRVKWEMSKHW